MKRLCWWIFLRVSIWRTATTMSSPCPRLFLYSLSVHSMASVTIRVSKSLIPAWVLTKTDGWSTWSKSKKTTNGTGTKDRNIYNSSPLLCRIIPEKNNLVRVLQISNLQTPQTTHFATISLFFPPLFLLLYFFTFLSPFHHTYMFQHLVASER